VICLRVGHSCQRTLVDQPGAEHNPNVDFELCDLADQMITWRDAGKTVFVHCVAAESRTPTVAAAYLAEWLGISVSAAMQRVREVPPTASPDRGFVDVLNRLWPGHSGLS
jgi:protein-tyrosine phosphatase